MNEFLAMGGYAFYVWTSFGLAAVLLGGIALWSALEARRVERATFARALRPRRETGGRAAGAAGAAVGASSAAPSTAAPTPDPADRVGGAP